MLNNPDHTKRGSMPAVSNYLSFFANVLCESFAIGLNYMQNLSWIEQ